jgi:hypothetical protein
VIAQYNPDRNTCTFRTSFGPTFVFGIDRWFYHISYIGTIGLYRTLFCSGFSLGRFYCNKIFLLRVYGV